MNDRRARWLALYALCLGDLMIVLDTNIVNVALPSIQTDLGFSPEALAWVVNAYMLTFGGFLLLSGRLGDLYGNRRVLLGGVAAFTVASVACAFAPNAGPARRRARRTGSRRRRRVRGGAGPDHGAVLRPRRAGQGDGRLRLRDVRRRCGRGAPRRGAHRPAHLALDLPGQRADRHRGLAPGHPAAARRHRSGAARPPRRRRGRTGHRRPDARGVRRGRRQRGRLDLPPDPRHPRPRRRRCWSPSWSARPRVEHPLVPLRLFRLRNVAVSQVVGVLWAGAMFACFFLTALYMQRVLGYGALEVGLAYLPSCVVMAADVAAGQRQAGDALRHPQAADRRARPGRGQPGAVRAGAGRRQLRRRTCCPAWCCSASAPASPSTRCCWPRWATSSRTRPGSPPAWSTPRS